MKLYYMPGACSLASHIVLEWLGKPYETHKLSRDELKGPEFLKINPLGAVPALADGDWTLTQNVAILEYLAEQAPQSKLMGDGSALPRRSAPLAGLHQLRPAQDLLAGLRADALPVRGRRAEGTGRQRVKLLSSCSRSSMPSWPASPTWWAPTPAWPTPISTWC